MASPQIRYPNAVFGLSAGVPTGYSTVVEYFSASATVTTGKVVVLANTSGQVRNATAGDNAELAIGIALEAATTGEAVPVATAGPVAGALKGASASTSGDILVVSGTTAGTVDSAARTTAVTQLKDIVGLVGVAVTSQTAGDTTITLIIQP